MTAPVIRTTSDGAARVVSARGPVRVVLPGAMQEWTGARSLDITATGDRTVTTSEGIAVHLLTARVGELTDATVVLREDNVALGDLTGDVIGWDADNAAGATLSGDATGGASGTAVLHLDIPDTATVGLYALTIRLDGVTWPTARRNWLITLQVVEDR